MVLFSPTVAGLNLAGIDVDVKSLGKEVVDNLNNIAVIGLAMEALAKLAQSGNRQALRTLAETLVATGEAPQLLEVEIDPSNKFFMRLREAVKEALISSIRHI